MIFLSSDFIVRWNLANYQIMGLERLKCIVKRLLVNGETGRTLL